MESSLEKELRQWRENRSQTVDALADSRERFFSIPRVGSRAKTGRRVRVNGQEVLVVSKKRRPLPS